MAELTENVMRDMVTNAFTLQREVLSRLMDPRRDFDRECGYPTEITREQYKLLYDRCGIATRVVSLFPKECWAKTPEVTETEDQTETPFEVSFKQLAKDQKLWHYIQRADRLSGVGHYGVLLIGLDDGLELNMPAEGIDENGETVGDGAQTRKVIYLRAFDESQVTIAQYQTDKTSPRYGQPLVYSITFNDPSLVAGGGAGINMTTSQVHWSRVVHLADNRDSSDVWGVPRMKPVFNYLLDLRKVLGGSGEMFWKGGFPGYSFEVDPAVAEVPKELDIPSLKAQIELFQNNLQRYMATVGVKVNSLAPQVADPTNHIEAQVKAICITLDVPYRIFMGTEKAELASSQDVKTWRTRCNQRNNDYTSPLVVRPVVDRLIALKCLPAPKDVEGYVTKFPDLNTETEQERADVASKQTECLTKYVSGGVDQLVPPQEYLTEFLKMPSDKAEAILKAAEKHVADTEASDAEAALEEAAAAAAAGLPAPGTPTAAVAGQQPPKPGQPSTKPPAAPAKV